MNYVSFSAIYDGLCSSLQEFEKNSSVYEEIIEKVKKGKTEVLKQFGAFFPSSVDDVLKRPQFSSQAFFGIIAKYPELLKGREKNFISFVASLSDHAAAYPYKQDFQLTADLLVIVNSSFWDDFAPEEEVNCNDCLHFYDTVTCLAAKYSGKEASYLIKSFGQNRWLWLNELR